MACAGPSEGRVASSEQFAPSHAAKHAHFPPTHLPLSWQSSSEVQGPPPWTRGMSPPSAVDNMASRATAVAIGGLRSPRLIALGASPPTREHAPLRGLMALSGGAASTALSVMQQDNMYVITF